MLTRRNERRRPTVGRHPRRGAWIRTRISGSLEWYTRLELVYADWQSAVLATGRIPRTYGAEYGSPTRLTGLEDQHLSDRPTPQRHVRRGSMRRLRRQEGCVRDAPQVSLTTKSSEVDSVIRPRSPSSCAPRPGALLTWAGSMWVRVFAITRTRNALCPVRPVAPRTPVTSTGCTGRTGLVTINAVRSAMLE
jgi:hypothetical protein